MREYESGELLYFADHLRSLSSTIFKERLGDPFAGEHPVRVKGIGLSTESKPDQPLFTVLYLQQGAAGVLQHLLCSVHGSGFIVVHVDAKEVGTVSILQDLHRYADIAQFIC